MAKITEADFNGKDELTLNVKIVDPHFESAEKDGDKARMALVLRGETSDGKYIDCHQYFTGQLLASGRNKGRSMFDVSAEQCHALGMPKPFNPKDIAILEGVECVFVCGIEEWMNNKGESKRSVKVKFINSSRKPALALDDAAAIWAQLSGEPVAAQTVAAKPESTGAIAPTAVDESDLPF